MLGRIDKYGTGSRRRSIPSAYEAYPTARLRATCRRGVSWVRAKSGGQGALATCLEYRYSTPVLWKPTNASQGSKKSAVRGEGCCSGQISGVEYRLMLPFEPFAIGLSDADTVVEKW